MLKSKGVALLFVVVVLSAFSAALVYTFVTDERFIFSGFDVAEITANCGGATPCACGDTLTSSRTMDGSDTLVSCGPSGVTDFALRIGASDIVLDCAGNKITGNQTLGEAIDFGGNFINVTIRNCIIGNVTLRGVDVGSGGNNSVIRDNSIIDLVSADGIAVATASENLTIINNYFNSTDPAESTAVRITQGVRTHVNNNTFDGLAQGVELDPQGLIAHVFVTANRYVSLNRGVQITSSSAGTLLNNSFAHENISGSTEGYLVSFPDNSSQVIFVNTSIKPVNGKRVTFSKSNATITIKDNATADSSLLTIVNRSNSLLTRQIFVWESRNVSIRDVFDTTPTVNYTIQTTLGSAFTLRFYVNSVLNQTVGLNSAGDVSVNVTFAANVPLNLTFTILQETCGTGPCTCGDTLTVSRKLTAGDTLTGCSTGSALTINTSHVVLDCDSFLIQGNGTALRGIDVTSKATNLTLKNCRIDNFTDRGIQLFGGGNNSLIQDNNITNLLGNATGILVDNNIENVTIQRNRLNTTTTTADGIALRGASNVTVKDNVFQKIDTAIELGSASFPTRNNIITRNNYLDVRTGVRVVSGTFVNNTVREENVSGSLDAYNLNDADPLAQNVFIHTNVTIGKMITGPGFGSFTMTDNLSSNRYVRVANISTLNRAIVRWTGLNITLTDRYSGMASTRLINYTVLTSFGAGKLVLYRESVFNQSVPLNSAGDASINVNVSNNVNNNLTFIISPDNFLPIVNLLDPLNNSITRNVSMNFTCQVIDTAPGGTAPEVRAVDFFHSFSGSFILNQSRAVSGPNSTVSFNVSNLPEGVFVWNCRGVDVVFNNAFNVTNFTVTFDRTAPSASASVSDSSIASGDSVTVGCSATDAIDSSPSTSLTVEKPDGSTDVVTSGSSYTDTTDSGTYTVRCAATDDAGNSASSQTTFTVSAAESGGGGGGGAGDGAGPAAAPAVPVAAPEAVPSAPEPTAEEVSALPALPFTNLDPDPSWSDDAEYHDSSAVQGEGYAFTYTGEEGATESHSVVVYSINEAEQYVEFTVTSDPQQVRVTVGDQEDVDLNADETDDLRIILNSIQGGAADVTFEKLRLWRINEEVARAIQRSPAFAALFPYRWFVGGILILFIVALVLAVLVFVTPKKPKPVEAKKIATLREYYQFFRSIGLSYESASEEQKVQFHSYIKDLRGTLAKSWLATSTTVKYVENTLYADVYQGSENVGRVSVPVFAGEPLMKHSSDREVAVLLQTLFGTGDDLATIVSVLEFISGVPRDKIVLWTPDRANRISYPKRVAGLDFDKGLLRISGSGLTQ